jgi:branched-chain amino acid transport system ATP-binding protein
MPAAPPSSGSSTSSHALLAVVGRLVVLNFGRKIAEGDPQTVMNSQEVREIYTGIEA